MDLQEAYNRLLFWINKRTGGWFPPEELDSMVDAGQLSYYKDCFIKYGTGQRLNDALAPFKKKVPFATNSTGFLSVPDDYMDLIDIEPVAPNGPVTCPIVNDDERTYRLNSQLIPVSTNRPFAEETTNWDYQLYPKVLQSGTFTYFARPPAPKFVYTVVSGRVIVYDQNASTQLLWGDDEISAMLIHTLETLGVNLTAIEISQWADQKNQQNLLSVMKL